jgi:hypothetical protein
VESAAARDPRDPWQYVIGEIRGIRGNPLETAAHSGAGAIEAVQDVFSRRRRPPVADFTFTRTRGTARLCSPPRTKGMQDVAAVLGVNIGFLFQKQAAFDAGVATLQASDPALADYLKHARTWSDGVMPNPSAVYASRRVSADAPINANRRERMARVKAAKRRRNGGKP